MKQQSKNPRNISSKNGTDTPADNSQDRKAYDDFITEANKNISQNSSNLDNNLLKLASLFLAGSLTIITSMKELYYSCTTITLLISGWFFLIFSIISVLYSIHHSNSSHEKAADLVDRLYNHQDESARSELEKINNKNDRFNRLSTILFVIGIILFTLFVSITIIQGSIMNDKPTETKPKTAAFHSSKLLGEGQKIPIVKKSVKNTDSSESKEKTNNGKDKKNEQ